MNEIKETAIAAWKKEQQYRNDRQDAWLLETFGLSTKDFIDQGFVIRLGMVPVDAGLQLKMRDGSWSEAILSWAELGELLIQSEKDTW